MQSIHIRGCTGTQQKTKKMEYLQNDGSPSVPTGNLSYELNDLSYDEEGKKKENSPELPWMSNDMKSFNVTCDVVFFNPDRTIALCVISNEEACLEISPL